MPRIFDNLESNLLSALRRTLAGSQHADCCVGYFHLRGWASLADLVEAYPGTDTACCRVLIGMHRAPEELMRESQKATRQAQALDRGTKLRLKKSIAQSFKEQIEFGLPTAEAERTLRQLARQLRTGKVRLKLFLKHPLHAKLTLSTALTSSPNACERARLPKSVKRSKNCLLVWMPKNRTG